MRDCLLDHKPSRSTPLFLLTEGALPSWLERQSDALRQWVSATGFSAKAGSICLVPGAEGSLGSVIVGVISVDDIWACGGLPAQLPAGEYHLVSEIAPDVREQLILGWALGAYQFTRYKETQAPTAKLVIDSDCDARHIKNQTRAIMLVRDLINTPAQDMMPEQLAEAVQTTGREFGAEVSQIIGDRLLEENYPVIHAVGRASVHAPRLIDLRWGNAADPKLTLVGKGVCFDSGGLDLKSATGMRLMKKDMGGAAHVLGLARLIMDAGLRVRLRVLIAAVENAVAGNAFHPGDVLVSRKGLSIEIDNTDAEGRLILCDALAEGGAENPDLMIDFATLTGAARVALGTEVPGLFCNNDDVANGLLASANSEHDPIWRMPLHKPYRELLDSKIADIVNSSSVPFGGAITAALFLQEFVPAQTPWAHFDLMAWNSRSRPGRPEGGEAMGLRAVFKYLNQHFKT